MYVTFRKPSRPGASPLPPPPMNPPPAPHTSCSPIPTATRSLSTSTSPARISDRRRKLGHHVPEATVSAHSSGTGRRFRRRHPHEPHVPQHDRWTREGDTMRATEARLGQVAHQHAKLPGNIWSNGGSNPTNLLKRRRFGSTRVRTTLRELT